LKTQLSKITEAAVTPENVYLNRRQYLKASALGLGAAAFSGCATHASDGAVPQDTAPLWMKEQLIEPTASPFSTNESLTPYEYVTGYNNFYEFGTDKSDPEKYGQAFEPHPWSVTISGAAENTGTFDLEDVLKGLSVEERIYRLRCVEAWSMVIPWLGVPLSSILARYRPLSSAQYVVFETVYRPEQMPGQRAFFNAIDYPYIEVLRIDEAMHPLTLMAVGVYGRSLPNQNGAPLRLVVPWKYGFKSIKSIQKISFVERRPKTTWERANPREYGFFANVNPKVSHPRWSQAEERRLPGSLFSANRIPTRAFNGYANEVASLYQGLDLSVYY
jgi:sulfoxide reductase catalytic subunit YedY